MTFFVRLTRLLLVAVPALSLAGIFTPCAVQSFSLYTPYTEISVPPGESIDYPIDVINKGGWVKGGVYHFTVANMADAASSILRQVSFTAMRPLRC